MATESKPEDILPNRIYHSALSYHDAAAVLMDSSTTVTNFDPSLFFPTLVLGCFALELFLKCLLTIEGVNYKNSRGRAPHGLKVLFDMASPESQTAIGQYFNQIIPRLPRPLPPWLKDEPVPDNIETVLLQANDAFVKLRYNFEGFLGVTVNHLRPAIASVRSRIEELVPTIREPAAG